MFESNVPLRLHSNYKIGGAAKYFCQMDNIDGLIKALEQARENNLPIAVLGGGTNILWSDSGFDGLVIKPTLGFLRKEGEKLVAGAGAAVADLLEAAAAAGLSGLEWAGGLPGSVGGAVRGNAGAFGGEIKGSVAEVVSVDFSGKNPKIVRRRRRQCGFGYRNSVFKSGKSGRREIIVEVVFQLRPGSKKTIKKIIAEKIAWRKKRQPLEYPNIGSIFKNIKWRLVPLKHRQKAEIKKHLKVDPFPVLPAATVIDKCGLKGVSCGGAMFSPKHPNFIVNTLNASAANVRALIQLAKAEARRRFGVDLEEEVVIF